MSATIEKRPPSGAVVAASRGGLKLTTVVGVVLIILKLVGVLGRSWWWVLAPFWIWPALVVVLIVGAVVAGAIAGLGDGK